MSTNWKRKDWVRLRHAIFLPLPSATALLSFVVTITTAQTNSVVHNFDNPLLGNQPIGMLAQGPDGTLYGTTYYGGSTYVPPTCPACDNAIPGSGTVFRLNADGSGYTVLKNFNSSDGVGPQAGVVVSGTTLYGTTSAGGSYGVGTVYKLNTDGSGYQVLKSFNEAIGEGTRPAESELVLSGATLYGTTHDSGSSNGVSLGWGTVFKINTDASGYQVLKNFNSGEEVNPTAGLVLGGSTLYGTTSGWAASGRGTVYKINTDGSGYMVLHRFAGGSDGAMPLGAMALSGSTLYGTTYEGGGNGPPVGFGTIFKINTDGSGYAVLKRLNSDAWWPRGTLALIGSMLFGTTLYGGLGFPGNGSVFAINTDGSGFAVLKKFNGADGSAPVAGLIPSSHKLYGTTASGGSKGLGVIFSLPLPMPTILVPPETQTAEAGSTVQFETLSTGMPVLWYEFFFNRTNALTGNTNGFLQLTNVQYAQSGAYTVLVTNSFGVTTSSPATLQVIAPVDRRTVPGVQLTGDPGNALRLEYTDALGASSSWMTLDNLTLGETSQYYFDLSSPLPNRRFYRTWQSTTPGALPVLDIQMVPAITLSGDVGNVIRLDYINAVGPNDAWVELTTVTLTNTSQLYFDTSAPGQPKRLYRLVPLP